MTTLTELMTDVYVITNRPDLSVETQLAVRTATLKAHHSDYYYKDLHEDSILFPYKASFQTIAVRDIVPQWRALKYVRKFDVDTNENAVPGVFLELLTPDSTLDNYSQNKENICYMAGLDLKIRTNPEWDKFFVGCYIHPVVIADAYESWIADEYPTCIILMAAAQIFNMIGQQENKATYQQLAMEEIALLKINNIVANGY